MSELIVIQETTTSNPAGAPILTSAPASISALRPDVVAKQDPSHTEADLMADPGKATRQRQPS
jgi:hypothetical protein